MGDIFGNEGLFRKIKKTFLSVKRADVIVSNQSGTYLKQSALERLAELEEAVKEYKALKAHVIELMEEEGVIASEGQYTARLTVGDPFTAVDTAKARELLEEEGYTFEEFSAPRAGKRTLTLGIVETI